MSTHSTPQSTPATKAAENASLRQQLADADKKRRRLLLALFLKHEGETGPILEILFDAVAPDALHKVESILAEGGAS